MAMKGPCSLVHRLAASSAASRAARASSHLASHVRVVSALAAVSASTSARDRSPSRRCLRSHANTRCSAMRICRWGSRGGGLWRQASRAESPVARGRPAPWKASAMCSSSSNSVAIAARSAVSIASHASATGSAVSIASHASAIGSSSWRAACAASRSASSISASPHWTCHSVHGPSPSAAVSARSSASIVSACVCRAWLTPCMRCVPDSGGLSASAAAGPTTTCASRPGRMGGAARRRSAASRC